MGVYSGKTYLAFNIKWDTDDDDVELPTTLNVHVPDYVDDDYESVLEYISDDITNQTDFCHISFETDLVVSN